MNRPPAQKKKNAEMTGEKKRSFIVTSYSNNLYYIVEERVELEHVHKIVKYLQQYNLQDNIFFIAFKPV